MNHDSQTTARPPRSALSKITRPFISVAEIRALFAGIGDFFRFLWGHKKRLYAYSSVLLFTIGVLGAMHWHHGWSLSRQVDRSSIALVEVEAAPVDVTRPWKRDDPHPGQGTGSIIDGHRILTAAHVVDDASKITVTRGDGGESYDAAIQAISPELDLAILTVEDDRFFQGSTPLDIQDLQHGHDELVAYGFPNLDGKLQYTIGMFSEAHRSPYTTSRNSNLKYTVDTPIKGGYSGGPLTWNGRLTGVIIELITSEETGIAVPAQVVRHFLEDIEDGQVDGSAALIGAWQRMENAQIRDHYGLTEGQTGVIVKSVLRTRADRPRLLPGDIILAIDGCNVGNDGKVAVEPASRVSFEYLIDRKQVGDTVIVDLLRDRRPLTVDIPLIGAEKDRTRLVRYLGDETPSFLVVGGFVFSTLTGNYVRDFDSDAIAYRTWVHQLGLSETYRTLDEIREEAVSGI
jgi:S1-C subfamily serine protease